MRSIEIQEKLQLNLQIIRLTHFHCILLITVVPNWLCNGIKISLWPVHSWNECDECKAVSCEQNRRILWLDYLEDDIFFPSFLGYEDGSSVYWLWNKCYARLYHHSVVFFYHILLGKMEIQPFLFEHGTRNRTWFLLLLSQRL